MLTVQAAHFPTQSTRCSLAPVTSPLWNIRSLIRPYAARVTESVRIWFLVPIWSRRGFISIHQELKVNCLQIYGKLKLKPDLFLWTFKCIVGGRYFLEGSKIACCRYILTGLSRYWNINNWIFFKVSILLQQFFPQFFASFLEFFLKNNVFRWVNTLYVVLKWFFSC